MRVFRGQAWDLLPGSPGSRAGPQVGRAGGRRGAGHRCAPPPPGSGGHGGTRGRSLGGGPGRFLGSPFPQQPRPGSPPRDRRRPAPPRTGCPARFSGTEGRAETGHGLAQPRAGTFIPPHGQSLRARQHPACLPRSSLPPPLLTHAAAGNGGSAPPAPRAPLSPLRPLRDPPGPAALRAEPPERAAAAPRMPAPVPTPGSLPGCHRRPALGRRWPRAELASGAGPCRSPQPRLGRAESPGTATPGSGGGRGGGGRGGGGGEGWRWWRRGARGGG